MQPCRSPSRDPEAQLRVRVSRPREPGAECASVGCSPGRALGWTRARAPALSFLAMCTRVHTHTHTHTHTLCWDCACHLVDSVGKGIPFSLPSQSVAPSPGHMWSLGPWGRRLGRGTQRAWGSVVLQVSSRSARPLLGVGSDGGRQG